MASRNMKIAALGVSTIFLFAFFKKIKDLKRRKHKLVKAKQKLRRKIKLDQPVRLQKSTLELYDSDSEAQRAKRPRLDEDEAEKSDDESIESIESSSDSESSDESCYSSLVSNSESDSTHSESFITDTEEDLDDEDTAEDNDNDNDNEPSSTNSVKPEVYDDPLATINYDDEDHKPDLDELAEALRSADKDTHEVDNSSSINNDKSSTSAPSSSSIRIKEEPRYY